MRTALVHYWLVNMRGGEQVLRELMQLHPEADVITNVYDPIRTGELFQGRTPPMTTAISKLPFARSIYPLYLPFMPNALEAMDLNSYDLVISSESGPAKWVIPHPNAKHICYVHSPMRYLWDQRLLYRAKVPAIGRGIFDVVTDNLRYKDVSSAARVDQFVANSSFVSKRIERYYRRDSIVIHPPVAQDDFSGPSDPEDFYLFAGQLVGYKGIRDAVDACLSQNRRLVVVGDGPEKEYVLRNTGKLIDYRGRVPRTELVELMRKCRALLFPGVEDFGIVPVEVLAAGRPVIAFGEGGILDTVTEGLTGVFFFNRGAHELGRAIAAFEQWEPSFDPNDAIRAAAAFTPANFARKWRALIGAELTSDGARLAEPEARLAS
jgi:glycosyltransferase involved in cell wall biosynthesis